MTMGNIDRRSHQSLVDRPSTTSMIVPICAALTYAAFAVPAMIDYHLQFYDSALTITLGVVLIALTVVDIQSMRLPDVITLPLVAMGLLQSTLVTPSQFLACGAGSVAGYVLIASIAAAYRHLRGVDGLGMGDAKLLAAAGAWVGIASLPMVLLVASVSGLLAVLAMKVNGSTLTPQTRIPFGPFLAIGLWVVWLYS